MRCPVDPFPRAYPRVMVEKARRSGRPSFSPNLEDLVAKGSAKPPPTRDPMSLRDKALHFTLVPKGDIPPRPGPGCPERYIAGDCMDETISLVVIDDNRLLREGLAHLIREQKDFKILAASADADEAMRKVREAKPDVVLLDFGLEDHDSLAITATVHKEVPTAKVIVLGLLPLEEDIVSFVRAGASGFIMRDATFEEFVRTIRSVVSGMVVLPAQLTGSLFNQIAQQAGRRAVPRELESIRLTQRERQVIDLIAEGLSNKDIAARLHIAVHTVKSHVHNVLEKLALHSRLEVAVFSRNQGDRRQPDN